MTLLNWEEEWELCNDDGFVYKRKKRRLDYTSVAAAPQAPPDPETEQRQKRERKKRALMKLRDQYKREISHWEHVSNTWQEVEQRTQLYQQQQSEPALLPVQSSDGGCRLLIEELLLQVEAQEAIINGVLNLCEVGEALCKAHEEQLKQSFIDLPVWDTARALMVSLSDE